MVPMIIAAAEPLFPTACGLTCNYTYQYPYTLQVRLLNLSNMLLTFGHSKHIQVDFVICQFGISVDFLSLL